MIERTTLTLFCLFTLIVLMAHALCPDGHLSLPQAVWYPKTHASFHDLLVPVRRRFWFPFVFQTDALSPELRLLNAAQLEHRLSALCY